jgi:hypothetical protein
MTVYKIYAEAGLSPSEKHKMTEYINQNDDFFGSSSYEKLFEYFCCTGEMPYGTAKATTGDPVEWILEKLGNINAPR